MDLIDEFDALLRGNDIQEYDFIVADASFSLLENRIALGISYAVVSPLWMYAKSQFDTGNRCKSVTRALVMVNADNYTAWNARKKQLLACEIEWGDELAFTGLVLRKHRKSGETWAHRRWILEHFECDLDTEFQLCFRTAELHLNNYYSWTHRTWVLQQYRHRIDFRRQVENVHEWTNVNISQHCGFAHLAFIVQTINETDVCEDEFLYIKQLIQVYPLHESLWMYARFCWKQLYDRGVKSTVELEWVEPFLKQDLRFAHTFKLFVLSILRMETDDTIEKLSTVSPMNLQCWQSKLQGS